MPAKMEKALKKEVKKLGLTGDRAKAYIYGTMRKAGWKPCARRRAARSHRMTEVVADPFRYTRFCTGRRMSDAFWVAMFGFAGMVVAQVLLHLRMIAAVQANTNITVAAATGRPTTPSTMTQLNDVIKAVADDKRETKEVAAKVADKVEVAAEAVKKALNGELEATINRIIGTHIEKVEKAMRRMPRPTN